MEEEAESAAIEYAPDAATTARKSPISGMEDEPASPPNVGEEASHTTSTPNISSYFSQAPTDDPFGTILTEPPKERSISAPPGPELHITVSNDLKLQEEDKERLYSPPVSKEELTNESIANLHDVPVDLSKTSPAEINRMYDAWIPTESTRRFLVQALATGGKFHLPPDKVLRPRLAMADTQADPVFQETFKLRGESETQKRQVLNLSQVEHTMQGLYQLIKAECWRSALDLTAILLTNMNQGLQPVINSTDSVISERSMKVWTVRIALLTKLKMYSIAEAECQQFSHLDSPELHFEFHYQQYPKRHGSMVPFSLRLLYACLPQFLGRHNESLDRLFYIKGQVNKILHHLQNGECEDGSATVISESSRAASSALWHQRELQVLYSLASGLTDMKEFRLATKIYNEILTRDPDNACFTYSTLARVYLQMGALKPAEEYFNQSVETCKDPNIKSGLALLHSGYLNICSSNYSQAPALFGRASSCPELKAVAKNNAAASMLYNEQVKAATLLLEELIMSDTTTYLQDIIVTNLCSLYELEVSAALAKKQNLLFLANQYKGNGFNINCLKM